MGSTEIVTPGGLIPRDLVLPPQRSFFLFGPRGTGKSTLLKSHMAQEGGVSYFNLLQAETFLELSRSPSALEARVAATGNTQVCIDEIQKLPALLDEVHRLIEDRRWCFMLSGSSARKLKRQGANLLAGRAVIRHLSGFNSHELGHQFDLDFALVFGNLPLVALHRAEAVEILLAYVQTYLQEEIREEGLVRRLDPFMRFLQIAGMLNGQVLNIENVAREAAVKRTTVDQWFGILEETLLGTRLAAWKPGVKVREVAHPKFYWFDPGVARGAAGLLRQPVDSVWLGYSLETLILHEMRTYIEAHGCGGDLFYYRSAGGVEIDLVVQTRKKTLQQKPAVICIEIKSAETWDRRWEKGIASLQAEKSVQVQRAIGIYRGKSAYRFADFEVLPVAQFLRLLHAGELF